MDIAAKIPRRGRYRRLFLASLLGLYFEMLIVRWLAAEIRLFSYFKNVTLMAAFLGLAIGFALAKRPRDHLAWFGPLLLLYVPAVLLVSNQTGFKSLVIPGSSEFIWRAAANSGPASAAVFALVLGFFFVLTVFLFLPLGQLTGRLMMGSPPLSAYMVNLLGSLIGIWLFAAVSFLNQPPWVWFSIGLLPLLLFVPITRKAIAAHAACYAGAVVILIATQGSTLWSPYYRIDVLPFEIGGKAVANPKETGYNLYVNQIGHMFALNLSPQYIGLHPEYASTLARYANLYNLPYSISKPQQVLVVGAGMGNDIAAGLRNGAQDIDAVEIDPVIYSLGRDMHPEHPYQAGNVNVIVDDARAFLEHGDKRYELIVFGILDSQTLLSGMTSVRLDNFIYTVESFRKARQHLADDGIVALTFDVERSWIKDRLAGSLKQVFGKPPIQISITDTPWIIYLAGPGADASELDGLCPAGTCTIGTSSMGEAVPLATDDWPYLYLEDRGIPTPYLMTMLLVVAIAAFASRKAYPTARSIDLRFFLLGAAFMLVEVRIVTELALLFGSTWIVNAIAVSAVLLMVLLANLAVSAARQLNVSILYIGLFMAMTVGYAVPLRAILPYGIALRVLFAWLLMGIPIFFASGIFSVLLKDTQDVTLAFSSNFLGSAVGGVLEYASMAFGIGSLYAFGALLYGAAWMACARSRPLVKLADVTE